MISVKNLSKSFGNHKAVQDVSFDVARGHTFVLLGTSGCGKTTTLRMLNRLSEPDSGSIFIDGKLIETVSPELLRRGIGYVLQNIALFPHYTVAQNIAIVPLLLGWQRERIEQRITELLQKLHLPEQYRNAYPSALSGGQQQRVGIARALAADPPVLLMDEAFSALDPVTRAAIRQDFKQLDELKDKTIVLVTHDVNEAVELADVICLMDKGKILQTGTPRELLFRPQNEFAEQFFAEQKLMLQYKIVLAHELWDYLPKENIVTSKNDSAAPATVYDAFTALHANGKTSIPVFNKNGNESVLIDAATLSNAFSEFQKAIS